MADLSGKVALITGAASGIGAAVARRFAADGASVVVADIDEAAGSKVAAESGGLFVKCDVAVEADLEAAIGAAVETYGRLDVFVGNAGIQGVAGPVTELDTATMDRVIDVNLRASVLGLKHACRAMQTAGGGSIIMTASVAALQGGLGPHVYSATKGGIVALARSVAREQAANGIRVNAICPGGTVTNAFATGLGLEGDAAVKMKAGIAEAFTRLQPIERAGQPEDMAAAAAFLASDDASFVTGQAIVVDGGLTTAYAGTLGSSGTAPSIPEPGADGDG